MNDRTIFINQDKQVLRNSVKDLQSNNSLLEFSTSNRTPSLKRESLIAPSLTPEVLSKRQSIFRMFLYVVIFTNYDTGVIPAALVQIKEELDLNFTQQALLGSLPNFGISFASFFVAICIARYSAKYVLSIALFLNIGFCALFCLSKNLWALYLSRFFMGFTQAFWVIYGPVWTNTFSPKERSTTWLGLLQGFSPLGIIFGYFVTGLIINFWTVSYSWRLSIIIQGILEILPLIYIQSKNNVDIDIVEYKLTQSKEGDNNGKPIDSIWVQTKKVLSNEVFMLSCFSVCVAFFCCLWYSILGHSLYD